MGCRAPRLEASAADVRGLLRLLRLLPLAETRWFCHGAKDGMPDDDEEEEEEEEEEDEEEAKGSAFCLFPDASCGIL